MRLIWFSICLLLATPAVAFAGEGWRAGVAAVEITPPEPMLMAGYASRKQPATGTRQSLAAKALVLEDAGGQRAVLVAMDLVGISRQVAADICRAIGDRHGIPRSAIALTTTHTHTGPAVAGNLPAMYFRSSPERLAQVDAYAKLLVERTTKAVDQAIEKLAPSDVAVGCGTAGFAVNRRNNAEKRVGQLRAEGELAGPVDHAVPVISVRDASGKLAAIVAGYACHATVMNDRRWSGDWPGAAQREIESRHDGAIAMFVAGCGGDQNPLPRRSPELMQDYGQQLAESVDRTLASEMKSLEPQLKTHYQEIPLRFETAPTYAELTQLAKGRGREADSARFLLTTIEPGEALPTTYPYPVQFWRVGGVPWVLLGGEVVVDYALRLKAEVGEPIIVSAYANDVMGYIPSHRVLAEGGYEGDTSRYYYGLPAKWHPTIEQSIVDEVRRLSKQ